MDEYGSLLDATIKRCNLLNTVVKMDQSWKRSVILHYHDYTSWFSPKDDARRLFTTFFKNRISSSCHIWCKVRILSSYISIWLTGTSLFSNPNRRSTNRSLPCPAILCFRSGKGTKLENNIRAKDALGGQLEKWLCPFLVWIQEDNSKTNMCQMLSGHGVLTDVLIPKSFSERCCYHEYLKVM